MKPMNSTLRLSILLAAASAALLSGCASAPHGGSARVSGGPRPAWVEGESAQWPRSRYITGVGSADDEAGAADRARGEVARVFSTDVSVNTTSEQAESTMGSGEKSSTSFSSTVADQVRTATKKALEGVNIVARWKDPQTGRLYALAALPKDEGLLAVTEKAHDIDGEGARYKAQLAAATDPFARAKAAAKLQALSKAWTALEADSRVLGGGSLSGDFDAAAARAEASKALSALDVVVAVTGDGADTVETAVVSGLNAVGLSAKRGAPGDKADLIATARVDQKDQDSGDHRWQRSRATASVSLQDGRTGKAFSAFDVSAREDAVAQNEARRRALSSLSKSVAEKVSSAITDFFANQ